MVAVTLTLSWVQVAALVYTIISLIITGIFLNDELSFVNPTYWQPVVFGFGWPVMLLSVASLHFGYGGAMDWYKSVVQFVQEVRCSHKTVRTTSQWTKEETGADEICEDCGKLFD